jgi:hypothetical protein
MCCAVTASTAFVAIAASTALPPAAMASTPALVAGESMLATIAVSVCRSWLPQGAVVIAAALQVLEPQTSGLANWPRTL